MPIKPELGDRTNEHSVEKANTCPSFSKVWIKINLDGHRTGELYAIIPSAGVHAFAPRAAGHPAVDIVSV